MEDIRDAVDQPISIKISLEDLYKTRNEYNINLKLQRPVAWNKEAMAKFIESLLWGYLCPPLEINKVKNERRVIDGKNRYVSIVKYLSNEIELPSDTPKIRLYNQETDKKEVFDLAGKKFKDLDQPVKNYLLRRTVVMDVLDNASDETEAENMLRLNSQVSMLGVMKARLMNYDKPIQSLIDKLLNSNFFRRNKFTVQRGKLTQHVLQCLYSAIAIECGVYDEVSISNYVRIGKYIDANNLLTEEIEESTINCIEKLDKIVPSSRIKWMNEKTFVPIYLLIREIDINDKNTHDITEKFDKIFENEDFVDKINKIRNSTYRDVVKKYDLIKKQYESV